MLAKLRREHFFGGFLMRRHLLLHQWTLAFATALVMDGCVSRSGFERHDDPAPSLGTDGVDGNSSGAGETGDHLIIVAGDHQTAVIGTPVSIDPRVRVVDRNGVGVAGIVVDFQALAGGGTASPVAVSADLEGYASTTWTVGSTAGTDNNLLLAGNSRLRGSPKIVTLIASATRPALGSLELSGPTTLALGDCTSGYTIQTVDASDMPVVVSADTTVDLSMIVGGAGILLYGDSACGGPPIEVVTLASGSSTASFWLRDSVEESSTLQASALDWTPATWSVTAKNGGAWVATTTTGAPTARYWHTGVWTGSEAIMWGGYDTGAFHTRTGARYNPVTESWTPTSLTGAPTSRSWHLAVWTGVTGNVLTENRMIVWGGRGPNNTGGVYDPAGDTWTATATTAGAPSPRYRHCGTWSGSEMYVWGGYDTSVYLNDGSRYDPAANTWMPLSTVGAPLPRGYCIAVWTGMTGNVLTENRMIIWGGSQQTDASVVNTGAIYDPALNAWTPMNATDAPAARHQFRGFWMGPPFNKLIVWGGKVADGTATNTGGIYDPAADTWTATSLVDAPGGRSSFSAVWTGSRMIVWGSNGPTGGIYDPVSDTWTPTTITNAPTDRDELLGPSTVWTGSQMIVWGGESVILENTGGVYSPPP